MLNISYKFKRKSIIAILAWFTLILIYIPISSFLRNNQIFYNFLNTISSFPLWFSWSIFFLFLLLSLLLPLSSASLLVLIGTDIFGNYVTFFTGILAGSLAAIFSYIIGLKIGEIKRWQNFHKRLIDVRNIVSQKPNWIAVLTFTARAVPNPLYDAWGYACGFLKVKFTIYLMASIFGGMIPLFFLCFIREVFIK